MRVFSSLAYQRLYLLVVVVVQILVIVVVQVCLQIYLTTISAHFHVLVGIPRGRAYFHLGAERVRLARC